MNIIIANSVGIDEKGYYIVHSPSRWSLGVKNFTDCIYYPWELAYTSALLKRETPENFIKFLDGILNRVNAEEYTELIIKYKPDLLIMEPSARTYKEDKKVAELVKKKCDATVIFAGGLASAEPLKLLETADYVCTGEYEETILEIVKSNLKDIYKIQGVYPNGYRTLVDINELPLPEDEDVSRIKYFEPNCEYKEIQFYISRGCPMQCNFCVAGNLYYKKPNWRPRKIDNIIYEIKYLKNKYPEMEGLFLDEEVHNIKKSFVLDFCQALIDNKLNYLKIDAMSEYYLLDKEILKKMKLAGYYKLRIGIETASDKIAQKMNLGAKFNLNKLFEVLESAKKIGIKMYGTFTIGGLGSNEQEEQKTIDLIYKLISENLLYDLQISINTPQPGTPFYLECKKNNYLITNNWNDFDGGNGSVVSYPGYTKKDIDSMYRKALDVYDKGLENRAFSLNFDKIIKTKIREIVKSDSKVVIIRSYRLWLINIILDSVNNKYKNSLICQNDVKNKFSVYDLEKIFCYGNGFINKKCFSSELIDKINSENFDYIIIPVRNVKINNFQNVMELIDELNINNILIIDSFGKVLLKR